VDTVNYSKYLEFTPKDGGEYYTLRIPEGVAPPAKGDHLIIAGNKLVVSDVSTPEDIAKGRGGPVARSMRENGIAYSVNCLPEGHKWLVGREKGSGDKIEMVGESNKQKRPGTTAPSRRIEDKIDERLKNLTNRHGTRKESNPNKKTGSKFGRRAGARKDPRPKLHRRPGSRYNFEGVDMDKVVSAVKHIIEHHGEDIDQVLSSFDDKDLLRMAARKCMATCLSGWSKSENGIVSENTDMILSSNSWVIAEDGSAQLKNGFKLNYDWLYDLANSDTISEAVVVDDSEIDKDSFSDALSNASGLLRKMNDKEIKKYILNAAKNDEDVDVGNLKKILEETGVNWKFVGAEVENEKVNLLIKVRYSKDGTQEGVVEKKLSIEVKPSADVIDATKRERSGDEVDLAFQREAPETPEIPEEPELPEIEPEPEIEPAPRPDEDLEGGLDLGVQL
jgi:hypothetical protein